MQTKSTLFNPWVFDKINTFDGYEVYWLHKKQDKAIEPESLYYNIYDFEEECEQIVIMNMKFVNYVFDDDTIEEWERIRDEEENEEE